MIHGQKNINLNLDQCNESPIPTEHEVSCSPNTVCQYLCFLLSSSYPCFPSFPSLSCSTFFYFYLLCFVLFSYISFNLLCYRGADKSLARPTSRCILFDGENISFDASLVIYTNSTNIPPIMIINRIYETQNLLSL